MAWRDDVIKRLAAVGPIAERTLLIALWELWRECDHTIKNLFEKQRLEIASTARSRRFQPLSERGDLHVEFFSLSDWDLVRELAILTAQLDQREALRSEWILSSVQSVQRRDGTYLQMVLSTVPAGDRWPRVVQGSVIRCLFRNFKIIPDKVADGVPVAFADPYPPQDRSTDDRAATAQLGAGQRFRCFAGGYGSRAEYRPTFSRGSGRPDLIALDTIVDGGVERLVIALAGAEAAKAAPSLTVFPELSIDRAIHQRFQHSLRQAGKLGDHSLSFVCPGTLHRKVQSGSFQNEADLYDVRTGRSVLNQLKLRFYKATEPEPPIDEDLEPGEVMRILPTPLGLVGILICRDFGDEREDGLIKELDLDYVLVPSMGLAGTYSAIKRAAKFFCRETGGTAVCSMQSPPSAANGSWSHTGEQDLRRDVYRLDPDGKVVVRSDWVYPPAEPWSETAA